MNQCIPKAVTVDTKVIIMERSREPPNKCVHILDAPPPGQQPARNSPSWARVLSGKAALANPRAICEVRAMRDSDAWRFEGI